MSLFKMFMFWPDLDKFMNYEHLKFILYISVTSFLTKILFMRQWLVLICLFAGIHYVQAQAPISGIVKDSKTGQVLFGATIKNKSQKTGSATAADGSFSVKASPGDLVEVTMVGYQPQVVKYTGQASLMVVLEPVSTELSEVVFVGNRGAARSKTESAVPVDVVKVGSVGMNTARPDLMSQLNMAVPSFNYNKQSGGDGSDAIDFASLRGLGFDQTLVLINGKRRHLSAFVNQVGTRGRGNSGTDLNSIPEAAIDRVEILRDGASAQYGSDAIAGVINIILKKDVNHLNITAGYSGYYDHKYNSLNSVDPTQFYNGTQFDGQTFTAGVDYGVAIGKHGGYINIGGNYMNQGKTFRAVPDTNVTTNSKALPVNVWRRAFGDGSVKSGGAMINSEIPIADTKTTFYFFGGYNYKLSNVYAWTRNFPHNASKYPTDDAGNLIYVPGIMRTGSTGNVYYNPQENVHIKDGSLAFGFKGSFGDGWDWDASNVIGGNDFHYYGHKTFNASLLPTSLQATKNDFDDGGFSFLQNTTNFDVSKHFSDVAEGLTLSFGGEFRYEQYKLYKGEVDSYSNGGAYFVQGGDTTFKNSGSEGYPGYQPGDEVNAHRTNVGGYMDVALDVTKNWLVEEAVRFENYSDFGFVSTQKFATRYKFGGNFNLRGSISTGFRAPSLQQINFSNTNTNIIAGQLEYVKLAPNYSPITQAAGVPKLTQETSVNGSVGFAWKPVRNLTLTVDGYWVQMKNRIVITGNFDGSVPAIAPYLIENNVSSVNFFANAVNTTNLGVDIVLDYSKKLGNGRISALLAGNIQHINIDKVNIPPALSDTYAHQQAFFSTREAAFLTASAPRSKFSLQLEYGIKKFSIGTHLTYFGKLTTQGFGYASVPGADPDGPGGANISASGNGWDPYVDKDDGSGVVPENFVFHGKMTTDIYVSFRLTRGINWVFGVDNIFNVHPDLAIVPSAKGESWGDSESGGPFDAVQMGFDGLRAFTKISFTF
jgi:iron complex outermembrane recepter protein